MHDGNVLETYLYSKKANRTKFADTLKMSKQNLYQLFDSVNMQPETKASLEAVIGLTWHKIEQAAKEWVNIHGNIPKRNGAVIRNPPDWRDEIIKQKINSNDKRVLLYARTNQALLKTVFQALAQVRSKLEKRKLADVQTEMNNQFLQHLHALEKEDSLL